MLIALLPGDGIGPEVIAEARRVLDALGLEGLSYEEAQVGGAAYKMKGHPLPPETLDLAKRADAILFGAVGDPACDSLERRSEEHTSELQSLMRISYAVFCLKKTKAHNSYHPLTIHFLPHLLNTHI